MNLLLIAVVALPAAGALAAALLGGNAAARAGTVAAGAASVAAAVLAVAVARGAEVSATVTDADGTVLAGLAADRLGVVLLLLVCGVSGVVQAFAGRYLHGDGRAGWFFASAGLLTSASAAMVTAVTMPGFALAWTIAGGALCLLLATYPALPAARDGVRRTARAFAVGDTALWLAVAVVLARWGDVDLRTLDELAPRFAQDQAATTLVACLLLVAALARSAQLPFRGWLPATLAAPTPVSALLHAGVVNAGGVLLVRHGAVLTASAPAMLLTFVAGAVTAGYGTVLMLAKPDVKGALAHSTTGQMGFMIMTCGLGAFAASIVHLVAHGMYKATLFLGSGSAVQAQARRAAAPPPDRPGRRLLGVAVAFSLTVPAAALAVAVAVLPGDTAGPAGAALLVLAWATGATASWGWLRRRVTAGAAVTAAVALSVAALLYVALVRGVTGFLALDDPGPAAAPWLAGAMAAVAVAVTAAVVLALVIVRVAPRSGLLGEAHRALYVLALNAGHVPAPAPRRPARGPDAGTAGRPVVPSWQGARS